MLAKVAVDAGIPALVFATFEAAGIALAGTAICWWRRDFPRWDVPSIRFYAFTGLTLVVLPYSFIYSALAHITGSLASIVQAMTPVFTAILAVAFGLERSHVSRWLGVLLSFAGIFTVVQQQLGGRGLGDFSGWVLVALAAPLSYAVTNVYAASQSHAAQSATARAAGSNILALVGMAGVLGVATATGSVGVEQLHLSSHALAAGAVAIAANVLASLTFFRLASLGGATRAGLASYITVLVGISAGWALLQEPVSPLAVLAAGVAVGGVVLAARQPHDQLVGVRE